MDRAPPSLPMSSAGAYTVRSTESKELVERIIGVQNVYLINCISLGMHLHRAHDFCMSLSEATQYFSVL